MLAPHDSLMNDDACRPYLDQSRDDAQRIVQPGRRMISDRQIGDRIGPLTRFVRRALVYACDAQHVRPGALHEAQVIGMIDHARKIGVLEIDAHRKAMLVPHEAPGIRLIGRVLIHCAGC